VREGVHAISRKGIVAAAASQYRHQRRADLDSAVAIGYAAGLCAFKRGARKSPRARQGRSSQTASIINAVTQVQHLGNRCRGYTLV
jgi:hypothetical protein